jgi:raffinose/stachyose/melibiose transport system substrate-binding protein
MKKLYNADIGMRRVHIDKEEWDMRIRKLVAALLSLTLLAGFAVPALAEDTTITIIINQTWNKPSMETLAAAYEEANPGVKIDYQVIPDNEFGQLVNAKMASKEVPEILMDNYQSLAKTVNMADTFADIRDRAWYSKLVNKDQIVLGDGGAYLLPINGASDPFGMVYNTAVYEKCGITQVPTTYDEFLADCEKIKAQGITPIVLTGKDSWTIGMWDVTMFPNVVYSDGGVTWDDLNTGKVKFADVPGFKRILDVMNELVAKGYVNEDFLATTYDMGQQMISEGQAAMTLQGAWFINECTTKYPDVKFSMYPFPFVEKPKFASGQFSGFLAFKNAKNADAALKFLDWVAQPENMEKISADWNFIPPFKECKSELPYWIKDFMANYLDKGDAPLPEMAISSAVEIGYLTTLTIDMLAGAQTAEDVLKNWDAKFAELATIRQLPGWVK